MHISPFSRLLPLAAPSPDPVGRRPLLLHVHPLRGQPQHPPAPRGTPEPHHSPLWISLAASVGVSPWCDLPQRDVDRGLCDGAAGVHAAAEGGGSDEEGVPAGEIRALLRK